MVKIVAIFVLLLGVVAGVFEGQESKLANTAQVLSGTS